jgi:hypothetical protein
MGAPFRVVAVLCPPELIDDSAAHPVVRIQRMVIARRDVHLGDDGPRPAGVERLTARA